MVIKMKEKWSAGKITALVLGIIALVIILWMSFIISLYQLTEFFVRIDTEKNGEQPYRYEKPYRESRPDAEEKPYVEEKSDEEEYLYREEPPYRYEELIPGEDVLPYGEEKDSGTEYYDFHNEIREDLNYQAAFDVYKKDDFIQEDKACIMNLYFDYPVISGDIPNIDGINQAVYGEIEEVEEYMASAAGVLSEGDVYDFAGTGYVTYMSEEFLSVVFVEYGYLNEEYLESYVISLNFDVQTGMALKNTELLSINDDFSIDFRERCEEQNGEIAEFYYMSDQEITSYLTDRDCLIIFYTPLGMEIGFNYYEGWVTVTYKDYEQYRKHL